MLLPHNILKVNSLVTMSGAPTTTRMFINRRSSILLLLFGSSSSVCSSKAAADAEVVTVPAAVTREATAPAWDAGAVRHRDEVSVSCFGNRLSAETPAPPRQPESALAPVGYGKLGTRDFFRPAFIWRRRTRRAGLLWQRVSPARQRSRGARSRVRLCTWPGSPAGVALVTFVPAPASAHVPRRVR